MTLLIELAVKSTVVAGAALVLLSLLGRRSAAERSWVAHAALAVLAALPAAVLLLPRWRLLPPVESAPVLPAVATLPAPEASAGIDPSLWLQVFYGGGVALLLLATLVAVLRLVALRRDADVLADPHWLTALARAKARMKVTSGTALLVSTAVTSPVSWGLVKPTIVVNQGLVASKDDAEAVIAHELAHVVRRDWAKLIGARLVTAVFWFNPLVWALASQCHQLREEAADDAVLGAEVSSADYANLLVEAARHHGRSLAAAHGVAPGKGSLHRRVTRVLDAAARRTPTRGAWGVGVVAAAAVLAAPLAAATVERAEPSAVTVRSTQAAATPPRPIVIPRNPEGSATFPRPIVTPRASTVPPNPVVARRKVDRTTTPPPPVVVPRKAGAAPAALSVVAAKGVTLGKGKLILAGASARPSLAIGKPGAPRLTVAATASPGAPKAAVAEARPGATTVLGTPGGKIVIEDGLTMVRDDPIKPRPAVTITGKASATGSSSSSHTTTTNGKTVRVEAGARGDWKANDADWREDQRTRFEDQRDRLRDEAERREDEADHRRDEAERIRDQREAERDAARDARRAVEAQAAKQRRVQQQAAAPARQKPAATLP